MKSIRWFSSLNPWIDVVVVVNDADVEKAKFAVDDAETAFWNDEENCDQCYGDVLEGRLRKYEVEAITTIYHDSEREDLEYEEQWETLLDGVMSVAPCVANYGG